MSESNPQAEANTNLDELDKAAQLNAILEAAFLIAAADGELSDKEFTALSKAALSLFGPKIGETEGEPSYRNAYHFADAAMTEEELNNSLQSFADLLDEQSYAQRVAYIAETLPDDAQRQQAFKLAVGISMEEGGVPDSENTVIHDLAKAFSFSAEKTNQLLDEVDAARAKR